MAIQYAERVVRITGLLYMNSPYNRASPFIAFALSIVLILAAGLLLDRDHFIYALTKGKLSAAEESHIKETVKRFNSIFVDIADSMGKTSSDDVPATKSMRHKLYMDTGVSAMAKQVLVYDLATQEILSVVWQDPLTAVVLNREAWNYQYRDVKDLEELDVIKGMDDEFRYVLVKRQGKWLVHRSSALLKGLKK